MKLKKIKLQLNKETIASLNDAHMDEIVGGAAMFSSAFLCVDSKCVCAPPPETKTNTKPNPPAPDNDSWCDAGVCPSAHSITKGTAC